MSKDVKGVDVEAITSDVARPVIETCFIRFRLRLSRLGIPRHEISVLLPDKETLVVYWISPYVEQKA